MRSVFGSLAFAALCIGCNGQLMVDPPDQCDDDCATADGGRTRDAGGTPIPMPDGGSMPGDDAGSPPPPVDSGSPPADAGSPPPPPVDAGSPPPRDAGSPPIDAGPPAACVEARRLWFEDWESGDYRNWTNHGYGNDWGNDCQSSGFSTVTAYSGTRSHRSEIVCPSHEDVHRGYGGVQFSGDTPLGTYTNTGVGTEAPGGMVNTFWINLQVPYDFGGGRWMSLWTTNGDCGWAERVITLGLEDSSRRITPAHVRETGGTVTFSPGAPSLPLNRWVRVTVYVNYHTGVLHVWQDGASVVHGTFSRPSTDICQWHWGAYASGDNDDIVLYEDDKSIWKLDSPWTDWSREPWLDGSVTPCP